VIRHLLKLVWHRKRSTGLLMLEIAVSFLVVFTIALFALRAGSNWRRPLGFEWQDVWAVEVDPNTTSDAEWGPAEAARMRSLLAEARGLPHVEAAAGMFIIPYELSWANGDVRHGQRRAEIYIDEATDGLDATMRMPLVAGRFFGPQDEGSNPPVAVLNRRLARELFDGADAVGQVVNWAEHDYRVVGVVEDLRQAGELSSPANHFIVRMASGDAKSRPPRQLLLRVAPGTPATFEQEVLTRLAPVVPGWSLGVQPLSHLRHTRLQLSLVPLLAGGVVAGFLLLMVGLGLLGVLWQNVTRRTRELGLRRAAGASRAAVHRQVLLELVLITSLAVAPALLLVLQLPLLSSLGFTLEPGVLVAAVVTALLVIYALAMLCGFYPSRMATRLPPAEALRWE
jgi:putative ABC transport system permease protein